MADNDRLDELNDRADAIEVDLSSVRRTMTWSIRAGGNASSHATLARDLIEELGQVIDEMAALGEDAEDQDHYRPPDNSAELKEGTRG